MGVMGVMAIRRVSVSAQLRILPQSATIGQASQDCRFSRFQSLEDHAPFTRDLHKSSPNPFG